MKKENWQAAFGVPSASFDARFHRTLDHLDEKEEKKVKRISFRAVLIALALLLALTGAAYAATQGWMIGDYMGKRTGEHVPEDFESGYAQNYTADIGGLRFRIRDAYLNGNSFIALTEVSRIDGKPAVYWTDGVDIGDAVCNFDQFPKFEGGDMTPLDEYAEAHGMPIHFASNGFSGSFSGNSTCDEWMEDDWARLVFYEQIPGVPVENGKAELIWTPLAEVNGEYVKKEIPITLAAEPYEEWEVQVNREAEKLPVVVDTLYLRQTRMDLQVDLTYHIDLKKATEEQKEAIRHLRFEFIDPDTGSELPIGARAGGFTGWLDEERTRFRQELNSIALTEATDALTLRLRCWPEPDADYGTLTVKIR